jgi:hypothetical protein
VASFSHSSEDWCTVWNSSSSRCARSSGFLQRQQLVGAQVALVVARAFAREDRASRSSSVIAHAGSPAAEDLGQRAQVDVPARDDAHDLPAARAARQRGRQGERAGALGDRPGRAGERRTAAAVSSSETASAPSTSSETRGHIGASTLRLPEPSTNDGLVVDLGRPPAASAAPSAAPVSGSTA